MCTKLTLSGIFLLVAIAPAMGQPCPLLTRTFAMADTIHVKEGELYRFRFSSQQLAQLGLLPDLAKPVEMIEKIQATLDQDNSSLREGLLWQLDEKLAEKQLSALRNACPQTGFGVFEKELIYYRRHYKVR